VVTNLSRVLFALGKLKLAGVGLVAQQLLPAALSFPLVLLAPPHLAVGALALASSVGQIAVAVPMVIATRRLRGSASVAGLGHATFAGIAAAAAAAAAGLAVALVMPTGGAVLETGVGAVSTLLAIVVFGVLAYALDKRDVRSAVRRLQRFTRNRT
jgi:putative peptidoglycan lipid II flippase